MDGYGRSPVMLAAMYNKTSILRYLLTNTDIPANGSDLHGLTALHYCCAASGKTPVKTASILLSAGGNPIQEDNYGVTPLHKAAAFGQHEIVRLMAKQKLDINVPTGLNHSVGEVPTSAKDSALHISSRSGNHFMTEQLLRLGADPSYPNAEGNTALHDAVRSEHPEVVSLLLSFGADTNKSNKEKELPGETCSGLSMACLKCKYLIASHGIF